MSRVTCFGPCIGDRRFDVTPPVDPLRFEPIVRAAEHADVFVLRATPLADGINVIELEKRTGRATTPVG